MRYLIIGDTHIKNINQKKLIDELIRVAQEEHPDRIVLLGDDLNDHEKVKLNSLQLVAYMIKSLAKVAPVIKLIGNHERSNNKDFCSGIHPFQFPINNTTIVECPMVIENIAYIPYVENNRFQEAMSQIELNNFERIFCHQEFAGVQMGHVISKSEDSPNLKVPVISGHIHTRCSVGNVFYLGSPSQHNFADDENKAVLITDFKGNEKYIKLNVPRFITYHYETSSKKIPEIPVDENFHRLVISGTSEEIFTLKKNGKLDTLMENGVKIVYRIKRGEMEIKKNVKFLSMREVLLGSVTDDEKTLFQEIV